MFFLHDGWKQAWPHAQQRLLYGVCRSKEISRFQFEPAFVRIDASLALQCYSIMKKGSVSAALG